MSRITHDLCDWLSVPHHEHNRGAATGASFGRKPEPVRELHKTAQRIALPAGRRMVLAGGSGYLGRLLSQHFQGLGWEVITLTRAKTDRTAGTIHWDGSSPGSWAEHLNGADALINLAGRSVNCRYHARNRRQMMDSRIATTRVLGEAIAQCTKPPQVWLNASTATIYRHTFGQAWDEKGEIGGCPEAKDEFSVEIATEWERAFDEAPVTATRKIKLRTAMVLGKAADPNNALRPLSLLARLGLGGRLGNGRQFMSWIHETDFCRAIEFLIARDDLAGIVNLAAPEPLPNAEFMRALRRRVGMPVGLPAANWMLEVGAFLLRTETELLIKSRRVVPARLLEAGFMFKFPSLGTALEDLL